MKDERKEEFKFNFDDETKKENNAATIVKSAMAALCAVAVTGMVLYGVYSFAGDGSIGIEKAGAGKEETTLMSADKIEDKVENKKIADKLSTKTGNEGQSVNTPSKSVSEEITYPDFECGEDIIVKKVGEGFLSIEFQSENTATVGGYSFKHNYEKGISLMDEEGNYNYLGSRENVICTDGKQLYYAKNADVVVRDLKTGEEHVEFTVTPEIAEDYEGEPYAKIYCFVGDNVYAGGYGDLYGEGKLYAYNKSTKDLKELFEGKIDYVDENYILVKKGFNQDVSGVPYEIYEVNGDDVELVAKPVKNGLYMDCVKDKIYFFEWNKECTEGYVVRCDSNGENIEKVLTITGDEVAGNTPTQFTDKSCMFMGEKYEYQ